VACLLFTCPKTGQKVPTGVEMDVQGLRANWKSTLRLDCPHCDASHDVRVREVYLNSAVGALKPNEVRRATGPLNVHRAALLEPRDLRWVSMGQLGRQQ
jgi:hypothetical protein